MVFTGPAMAHLVVCVFSSPSCRDYSFSAIRSEKEDGRSAEANVSVGSSPRHQLGQIGLFIAVGLTSTLVDFTVYNLLTGKPFRRRRIHANLASTTVAMMLGFTINLLFVFRPDKFSLLDHAIKFVLVTGCSLYVLQSIVIYMATNIWKWPVLLALVVAKKTPMLRNWSEDVISRNMVKLLATGFSLVWNFLWYKFYVFR